MRTLIVVAILVSFAGAAAAQPGQTAPQPYPPPAQPYPPPAQPYPPPQQPYYPQQPLTPAEAELLRDGEISDGAHVGGGLANIFVGFGLGQAIQGRWTDKGWIFTVGEAGSFVAFTIGLTAMLGDCFEGPCDDDNDGVAFMLTGMIGLAVFRIWSVIDAFAAPPEHNRRVRDLKARLGMPIYYSPYVAPVREGDGAVGGLTIRF